jgi:protein-disulfide isomerase
MKKIALFVLLCNFGVLAQAPAAKSSPPAPASDNSRPVLLPGKDLVEAAMQRTLGYDPNLTWQIYDIRASAIPDVADVLVSINKQAPQHIYMSTTSQIAIIGEMIPFGRDPYGPARAKLQAADGPALGATNPTILIVDFSDLECPHCKAAHPKLEKLVTDFPQVRLVFEQFPLPASLHPWAMKAAQYADCVGRLNKNKDNDNQVFWKYVDTVFENQGSIAAATADDQLKGFAATLGLDGQKIANCSTSLETEAHVKKSMDLGQELDVNQTPTVFINGRRVLGPADIPYEQLKALVQFEIDHAGK